MTATSQRITLISSTQRPWVSNGLSDSLDFFRKTLEVNVLGTFCINAAVGDAINKLTVQELGLAPPSESTSFWTTDQERGVIVNFASVAGHEPIARVVGYGPSKSCVLALTKSIADFYGPSGIRVNSVSPGIVDTPMVQDHMEWFQSDLTANAVFPKRPSRPVSVNRWQWTQCKQSSDNADQLPLYEYFNRNTSHMPSLPSSRMSSSMQKTFKSLGVGGSSPLLIQVQAILVTVHPVSSDSASSRTHPHASRSALFVNA